MANPHVRPHLCFYPEDTGKTVNEYWQAHHWLNDADPEKLTPMAVIDNQHFFIYEPCLLKNGIICMPTRWFMREKTLMARAWTLRAVPHESIGGRSGWIVEEFNEIEVSQNLFLVGFETWSSAASTNGLPSPSQILGKFQ
jgi:hypothetical protein